MRTERFSLTLWLIPFLPIALACGLYFSDLQTSSFMAINRVTRELPDLLWAGLTFLGNGWGIFAVAFPMLLLAPRLLSSGILAGIIAAIVSSSLKPLLDLPRPAGSLANDSFYRIGDALLYKAFPSGHTLTAFAIATALYFSIAKNKRIVMLPIFIVAGLVGLSRIAVGAHWLTDVLAGVGLGIWCGLLGASLAQSIPDNQLLPTKIGPRIVALGGLVTVYALLTQSLDLDLNQPFQYLGALIIVITLAFFIKAQISRPT